MTFPDEVSSNAIGIVTVTPTGSGHCDGATVRIQPTKLGCEQIGGSLAKRNMPTPQLASNFWVYPLSASGQQIILLPAASGGCVVVTTGARFGS
jgi:hypothetical protein